MVDVYMILENGYRVRWLLFDESLEGFSCKDDEANMICRCDGIF